MSQESSPGIAARIVEHELRHLQKEWWWFVILGVVLTLSGLAAIIYPCVTSLAAVIVLGMSLLISGAATIVTSFWTGRWNAFLLQLLVGVLYAVVGFVIMDTPISAAISLTVFVAAMFLVVGIVRSVAALALRFPQWGWALLSGMLTALLGLVILKNLSETAFWAIGLLIGIELLFDGWYWIMLGVALWRLPAARE